MSVSSPSENLDEIKEDNLEYLLLEDEGFVDFFNSFLALPCFAARLHYNSELEVFEEFIEKIADDVGKGDAKAASQLHQFTHFKEAIYNVADNQSSIGYYVTILDKVQGLEFIKKHRLPLFLRSELYAEYKLSKHLSAVQESFFRGLYSESSDEDEDSGVEEPNVFHPGDRTRSVVSFNLTPSLGEAQSTDGEAESDHEGHMYLPTNVRSIEETFDAWHESFKLPESRTSLFSSGGGSPYPLRNPQIREEDEFAETRSSSSCYSAQESDVSVPNNVRPASRLSFVSDNTDKTLSPEPRSGVNSASRDALALETASQTGSFQEGSNIGDQDYERCKDPPGVDEMTRSLSSALSFIAEHGQVKRNSPPPEKFVHEPALDELQDLPSNEVVEGNNLYISKEECIVKSQRTDEQDYCPSREKVEENGHVYGKNEPMVKSEGTVKQKDLPSSKEVADSVSTVSEEESIGEFKPVTTSDNVVENISIESAETEREKYDTGISEHPLPALNENHVSEKDERVKELSNEGKVPSINVEIMCSDDGAIERGNTFTDTTVDLAESVSEENSESIAAEEFPEELSEATEDLSNTEETSASVSDVVDNSGAVESAGGQDEEKQEMQTLQEDEEKTNSSEEGVCLHCKTFAKEKNAVPIKDVNENHSLSDDDSKESKLLDLSSEAGETTSVEEHSVQKTTENESIAEETGNREVSTSTVLEHDSELKAETSAFSIREEEDNEKETEEKDNKSEVQDSQGGMVEDKEPNEDDVDEEGDYTTEASATTLQGIRGVFGKKRRCSTAATSVDFDVGEAESAFSEDGSEMEDRPYDLAMKEGFDSFKEFLLETSGEKLLQFWLEVECGRYLNHDEERNRLVQCLRDKFWRSGGIYEFSTGTKSRLNMVDGSTLTYKRLYVIQPGALEPLLSYWCIRFTMHQQRRSHCRDLDYNRLSNERPKSCVKRENALANLPQVPSHMGLSQVLPSKTMVPRPQTSCAKKMGIQHQTSRSQVRAKSAHPRLLQAAKYMHTNASTKQLQNIIAPVKTGYGFEQPPAPSFPVEPAPDYLPTVRLFINPVPSPDSKIQRMMRTLHRTAVFVDGSTPTSVEEAGSETGAMLDSLIQGLIYERQTGNYFNAFLQNSGNKLWMNCLAFWKSLQEYNAYFFADSLNPSLLSRKARTMYATFVVSGSAQDIHVHSDIQLQVHKELEPPYEELFDAVEEHVLHSLLEPWNLLIAHEKESYTHEVPTEQRLRHIEVKVMARRRQSLIQTPGGLGNAEDDHEKERISVEEANRPAPVPKDGITFEALIRNRDEVEHFKEFLNKKHTRGIKDLMAWTDMETFLRVPRTMEEKRDKKAREIRDSWLGKKYFFGPDSPATREGRNLIMNLNGGRLIKERPQSPVILESQKFVRARIERRWLMLFKQTAEFLERQKPRAPGVPEMVEDIMLKRRLQRSEAAWKILNSRWVSSSRDVVALRQTLLNPSSCSEFTAFVAVKGDTLESNVHFWLEVQKFKDLCHAHAQPALIQRKVQTIVDCFLNSAIAPELQIDIPIEMADKLMERLLGRSPSLHPYVFREAQMTVFRVLFNHWKEFVTYRSKIPEGQDPREHFTEMLRRHRADNKSKKEASERRRMARLSAERKKKEKEEREKKRVEDLASLFSTEATSIFYSEEDDLRSWFYSKHLVEQERQEHIKRLREQGIIIPEDELVEEKEDTKSRRSRISMGKSSSVGKKVHDTASDKRSSEGSSRILPAKLGNMKKNAAGQLSPSLVRRGSGVSTTQSAVTRHNSGVSLALSRKDDKTSIATMGKDEKGLDKAEGKVPALKGPQVEQKNERKISEIQVIPIASPEPLQPLNEGKLLPQRPRSSKRLQPGKQPPKSAGKKGVPLDAISCISDYSVLSNIDFQPRNTTFGRQSRQGGTSLLTSKSLKDFTNSPEGAQLSMPLPLVRITSASHVGKSDTDGSVGDPSPLYYKPRPLTQSLEKTPIRPRSRKGLGIAKEDMQIKPDVIVN